MGRSRTITVLAALLAAMTVGALALMVLETSPLSPPISHAAMQTSGSSSAAAVFSMDFVQPTMWRNIIVHGDQSGQGSSARQSHFVIDSAGDVAVSDLWKNQLAGKHVLLAGRDWNIDSIGICLTGPLDSKRPTTSQYRSLLVLVATLQQRLNISGDHVYLYRHLDAATRSPGNAFPADDFASRLLRPY